MAKRCHYLGNKPEGFTLIELVMVMVLIGILAVTIIPRFANKNTFDARGYFDQSISLLRYAQKLAIAQRRDVFVNIYAPSATICLSYVTDTSCSDLTNAAINPADQTNIYKPAPTGVVSFASSLSFSFSALGKPSLANTTGINMTGDGILQTITVERDTGYVH
jgi:MSHA pilin protein MshC